ncbi:MAG TPA: S8 family serine peptidase [Myxococcaceae bacterium]|nr:S8 family serine peptidase [Myxococcaceae bacterium]
MRWWALLGMLSVVACTGGEDIKEFTHLECPGVMARQPPSREPWEQTLGRSPWKLSEGERQPFLVRYRTEALFGANSVQRAGGEVQAVFHTVPAVAARLTPSELARLAEDPDVEEIEPDVEVRALGVPHLVNRSVLAAPRLNGSPDEYTRPLRMVQAQEVWDANEDGVLDPGAPTGEGIKVCVIDSGIDPRHPELQLPYKAGYDYEDEDEDPSARTNELWGLGHGTHVAGIIAAQLGSGGTTLPEMSTDGMVGVAPGVELLIARVLNVHERASVSTVMRALEWCQQQGANLVSLSLGSPIDMGTTAEQAFQAARDAGMLIIAASGNGSSPDAEAPVSYPAAYPSVLAVGAVDEEGELAYFSNRGPRLSLVAPGVDVLSSVRRKAATVPELEAEGQRFGSRSLFFAEEGDYTGELVDCGAGKHRGCKGGTCDGFVAYVRLPVGYSPSSLAQNVMKQGAKAIIFGADMSENKSWQFALEGPGSYRWVPATAVGQESRDSVRKYLGKQVRVSLRGVDYAYFPGTSMATPHVTGVAALVWSARPTLTADEVQQLLERTTRDLGDPGFDEQYGHGLVQAKAALDALQAMP